MNSPHKNGMHSIFMFWDHILVDLMRECLAISVDVSMDEILLYKMHSIQRNIIYVLGFDG